MDWARSDPRMGDKNLRTFRYHPAPCRVVKRKQTGANEGPVSLAVTVGASEGDWKSAFDKKIFGDIDASHEGLLILATRAAEKPITNSHETTILSKLPFSRPSWLQIMEKFHIHDSVARLINRNTAAEFSRSQMSPSNLEGLAIVYNCRSSASWPGDIALSVTWFPERWKWYAVFYGCDNATAKNIEHRLNNCEDATCHPLILLGMFAELERRRQISLVDKGSLDFLSAVSSLNSTNHQLDDSEYASPVASSAGSHDNSLAIDPWLKLSHLKNGIQNWKDQLLKMVTHADELNESYLKSDPNSTVTVNEFRSQMRRIGGRIKDRLEDIIRDCDEQMRKCQTNLDGIILADQMAHTQANMIIASRTKVDSSQMKSIALLTMIFLPATFVATLFSMTFFNWQPNSKDGEVVVSPRIWIYAVIAGGLTMITLITWFLFLRRRLARKQLRQPSKLATLLTTFRLRTQQVEDE
ncbi:hypothetical protein CDEST_03799 [Colletotrichum destructivum]|uniref:Uncharacterized protein n=1 Tax=Colletotrichum destructivum TaxID=34406 RepID=A0AAX4I687_9PEZI|nr:hypothetical protein CDEST_03799 [Colletotrichum destructivum]